MAAVQWLWARLSSGEFMSGAFPSSVPKLGLQGLDQEIGASLALLLGSHHTKRDAGPPDGDSSSGRQNSSLGAPTNAMTKYLWPCKF